MVKRLELYGALKQAEQMKHVYVRVHAYLPQAKLPDPASPGDGWIMFDSELASCEPTRVSRPKVSQSAKVE